MHDLKGMNVGVLVVPIVIFIGAAVSLGIGMASVPNLEPEVKEATNAGSNTLLLVSILLILGLFGLLAAGKKGSTRYRWP